ncbi:MAG: DUF1054 family protein [Mycobacterium leprae]
MSSFSGFTAADFDAFLAPGFSDRMEAIKAGPRPKLEALGAELAPRVSSLLGRVAYPIVAKHARRKVHPPNDTWVAFSTNPRGYKMLPHFAVGLWAHQAFIGVGVIYESPLRSPFARNLLAHLPEIRQSVPDDAQWLEDYTKPSGIPQGAMKPADFERIADKLQNLRHSDCFVSLYDSREEVIALGPDFADRAAAAIEALMPVYRLAGD